MLGRLRRRGRSQASDEGAPVEAAPDGTLDLARYPGVEPLLDSGDIPGAVALIASREPALTQDDRARIDLQVRHEAFRRASLRPAPQVQWPPRTDRSLGVSGALPEVEVGELDRDVLVAGCAIMARSSSGGSSRSRRAPPCAR